MAAELISLNRTLNRLGVAPDTDDAADALTLLRAVSAEVRALTKQAYEGTATIYNEVIDTGDSWSFLLPYVPVSDLLSVSRVYFDSTEDDIYVPEPVYGGWSTTLAVASAVDDTTLKVVSVDDVTVGDHVAMTTEVVRVTAVGTAGAGGTGLTVEPALRFVHASGAQAQEVSGSTYWRLVDADRGKVELIGPRRFVRVIWKVTGAVPANVQQGVEDWVASRWAERGRSGGQVSYSTGADSESWDAGMAGQPPGDVARMLGAYWRTTRNGVI